MSLCKSFSLFSIFLGRNDFNKLFLALHLYEWIPDSAFLHNLPTMASEEEGATTGAREEGYWNVLYEDTGQKETRRKETWV